jgi:hypothetical protein
VKSGRVRRSAVIGASTLCVLTTLGIPGVCVAELLFSDDFSSQDLSNHSDFFRWGTGSIPGSGVGTDRIELVPGPNGRTTHALRFTYRGTREEGASGDAAHFAEQRFHLTRSRSERRTRNEPSNVAYQEVWIAYWFRVPEDYYHANGHAKNNKGFVYLWKDRYEVRGSSVPNQNVTPTANSIQWWPTGSNGRGVSRVTVFSTRHRGSWSHMDQANKVAPGRGVPGGREGMGLAFLPREYGQWVRVVVGMRASDTTDAANGFTKIYMDGELAMEWTGLTGGANDGARNGYDRGYLLGYANSAFERTTNFYIADFRVGTSAASVGLQIKDDSRPMAPTLQMD